MQQVTVYALVAVNLVTFGLFGIDKWMARKGRRRIPEARLLLLAWATGMFGAWVGMSVFRHKTVKTSFCVKMMAVTLLNVNWLLLYLWLAHD